MRPRRQDRQRSGGRLHERSGRGRAGDPGDLPAQRHLAVALDEALPTDKRREASGVGHVGDHGERADQEGQRIKQFQAQQSKQGCEGDRGQHQPLPEVGGDEERASGQPVDPRPGGQAEQQQRQRLRRREPPHLQRTGPQGDAAASRRALDRAWRAEAARPRIDWRRETPASARRLTDQLFDAYVRGLAPLLTPVAVEAPFSVPIPGAGGWTLDARIDAVADDGWLIDQKTAGRPYTDDQVDADLQATAYLWAWRERHGTPPPGGPSTSRSRGRSWRQRRS
jgi:hypothetical protein